MAVRRLFSLLVVPALLAGLAFSIGAGEPPPGPEDADLFKGESVDLYFYHNPFFSFEMTIPGDWHPLSTEDLLRLMRKEAPGFEYSEQMMKEGGVSHLLSISRYVPAQRGPRGEFNPNILVTAWDLSKLPGVKTAKDYIEFKMAMIKAWGVTPGADPYPVRLGDVEFWRFDGAKRSPEFQSWAHVITIRKGYALDFQLVAGSKADMDRLDQILKSLYFE